jgi:hypothetical protein
MNDEQDPTKYDDFDSWGFEFEEEEGDEDKVNQVPAFEPDRVEKLLDLMKYLLTTPDLDMDEICDVIKNRKQEDLEKEMDDEEADLDVETLDVELDDMDKSVIDIDDEKEEDRQPPPAEGVAHAKRETES